MTMKGGEWPIDWAALAPHIEHPVRESVVEALRWIGPLSVPDLGGVLKGSEASLSAIAYHVAVLAIEGVLVQIGQRPKGASFERVYSLRCWA